VSSCCVQSPSTRAVRPSKRNPAHPLKARTTLGRGQRTIVANHEASSTEFATPSARPRSSIDATSRHLHARCPAPKRQAPCVTRLAALRKTFEHFLEGPAECRSTLFQGGLRLRGPKIKTKQAWVARRVSEQLAVEGKSVALGVQLIDGCICRTRPRCRSAAFCSRRSGRQSAGPASSPVWRNQDEPRPAAAQAQRGVHDEVLISRLRTRGSSTPGWLKTAEQEGSTGSLRRLLCSPEERCDACCSSVVLGAVWGRFGVHLLWVLS
jgi:hypothetical protein